MTLFLASMSDTRRQVEAVGRLSDMAMLVQMSVRIDVALAVVSALFTFGRYLPRARQTLAYCVPGSYQCLACATRIAERGARSERDARCEMRNEVVVVAKASGCRAILGGRRRGSSQAIRQPACLC